MPNLARKIISGALGLAGLVSVSTMSGCSGEGWGVSFNGDGSETLIRGYEIVGGAGLVNKGYETGNPGMVAAGRGFIRDGFRPGNESSGPTTGPYAQRSSQNTNQVTPQINNVPANQLNAPVMLRYNYLSCNSFEDKNGNGTIDDRSETVGLKSLFTTNEQITIYCHTTYPIKGGRWLVAKWDDSKEKYIPQFVGPIYNPDGRATEFPAILPAKFLEPGSYAAAIFLDSQAGGFGMLGDPLFITVIDEK